MRNSKTIGGALSFVVVAASADGSAQPNVAAANVAIGATATEVMAYAYVSAPHGLLRTHVSTGPLRQAVPLVLRSPTAAEPV